MKRKSDLLSRLSQEKPAHKADEIEEALKRGYSLRQIVMAMYPEALKVEPIRGTIRYSGSNGTLEVPYTYETFMTFCRLLLE